MLRNASQDDSPWNNTEFGWSKSFNRWLDRRWSDGNFTFVQIHLDCHRLKGIFSRHRHLTFLRQTAANFHVIDMFLSTASPWKMMQSHFKHQAWLCISNHVHMRIKGAESAGQATRDVTFVFPLFQGLLIHCETHCLPFVAHRRNVALLSPNCRLNDKVELCSNPFALSEVRLLCFHL